MDKGTHSHSGHAAGHETVHRQGEDINIRKIVVVGIASLALFAAGIVWAYFIMVGRENSVRQYGAARETSEIGKEEIGIVDQTPFSVDVRLDKYQEASRKKLTSYGWVDRNGGIARIPIEEAMKRVVASPPDIAETGAMPMAAPVKVVPMMVPPPPSPPGAKAGEAP